MGLGRMVTNQLLKRVTKGKIQQPSRMQAIMRLPFLLRLGYALFRDERVPVYLRVGTLGLLALVFSPIDIIGDIPVVGQFWDFTLSVVILEQFINLAPPHVVNEHIRALGLENRIRLREV